MFCQATCTSEDICHLTELNGVKKNNNKSAFYNQKKDGFKTAAADMM